MPAVTETYSLGAPVELQQIEQELKRLWHDGEAVMTRASLMNLAVNSEKQGAQKQKTQLMARRTEDDGGRAIDSAAEGKEEEKRGSGRKRAECNRRGEGRNEGGEGRKGGGNGVPA